MTSYRTFTQSFSSLSVFIFDCNFNRFITCLQRKPFRCELLLIDGTYQNTTLAVLRLSAPMKSDAAASGNSLYQRQHALESWRPRYSDRIYPNRYDIICILNRRYLLPFKTQAPSHGLALSANSCQADGFHVCFSICKCSQSRIALLQRLQPRQIR